MTSGEDALVPLKDIVPVGSPSLTQSNTGPPRPASARSQCRNPASVAGYGGARRLHSACTAEQPRVDGGTDKTEQRMETV